MSALKVICGKTGPSEDVYDDADYEEDQALYDATEHSGVHRPFYWSQSLQDNFREELEKYVLAPFKQLSDPSHFATTRLVILGIYTLHAACCATKSDTFPDYLMLNTDRGADNYMIKFCDNDHSNTLVDVAPSRSVRLEMPVMSELRRTEGSRSGTPPPEASSSNGAAHTSAPRPTSRTSAAFSDWKRRPHVHIAAIDNSLSFPHEHPQGWRSYTYGWLFLPVSLIGRPFSDKTRNHFLPLLTSKAWWEETTYQLEKLFSVDPDFHPKMFAVRLPSLIAVESCLLLSLAISASLLLSRVCHGADCTLLHFPNYCHRPSLEHRTISETRCELLLDVLVTLKLKVAIL
jgi:phosphatidylinositol 4-kinase type 2